MSPVNSTSSVRGTGHVQEVKVPDLLKEMNKAGLLNTEIKNWLKAKHPELNQVIQDLDHTGGHQPTNGPFDNYPAGTRYAVVDKNEL